MSCNRIFGGTRSDGIISRAKSIVLIFIVVSLGSSAAHAQSADLNNNGMSVIWEWLYNAYGVDPKADPDGDGFSNFQEAIANTDPFNSNSCPYIPTFANSPSNFSVTVPSSLGKQYQLQSTSALGDTNWVVETSVVARSGTSVTLTAPTNSIARFYRVAISDVYSTSDGLSDWEAYQLGLDPFNPYSNGGQDAYGNALSDFSYATNMLASQNLITIAATDAGATQPDPGQSSTLTGQFTITRGGFPLDAITVNFGPGRARSRLRNT